MISSLDYPMGKDRIIDLVLAGMVFVTLGAAVVLVLAAFGVSSPIDW